MACTALSVFRPTNQLPHAGGFDVQTKVTDERLKQIRDSYEARKKCYAPHHHAVYDQSIAIIDELIAARAETNTATGDWVLCSKQSPSVPEGDSAEFVISVYRKQTGKYQSCSAYFLNEMPLDDGDGNEEAWSGWCVRSAHPEYLGWYERFGLDDGDEIVAWTDLPQLPDTLLVGEARPSQ